MQKILSGKRALVVGGSRGIGRAIAEGLAKEGALVAVNFVKDDEAANKIVEAITTTESKAIAIRADNSCCVRSNKHHKI